MTKTLLIWKQWSLGGLPIESLFEMYPRWINRLSFVALSLMVSGVPIALIWASAWAVLPLFIGSVLVSIIGYWLAPKYRRH